MLERLLMQILLSAATEGDPDRLKNKTAIVTGAGTGIGKAIAKAFAAEGARVSLCGRSEDTLNETAVEIRQARG